MRSVLFIAACAAVALAQNDPVKVQWNNKTLTLQIVQAIWRHGDRSPTMTFPSDPIKEANWTFGGSGWGQLSPRGMAQHVILGSKISTRYVDTGFLSPQYNSHEIYVRSTDVNRTIISAMSNLIGMYGQPKYNANTDNRWGQMPNASFFDAYNTVNNLNVTWPSGFVPIAIHTVDDDTDFIANPDWICPRRYKLWDAAKNTKEVQAFLAQKNVSEVLDVLNNKTGMPVNLDNLWIPADTIKIERIYFKEGDRDAWANDDFYAKLSPISDIVDDFQDGAGYSPVNNVDIGLEIKKTRGGSMVNTILDNMNRKVTCNKGVDASKCGFVNKTKYYVFSAHDSTIAAYLWALGAKHATVPNGFPLYSSAVMNELYTDDDGTPYFRIMYHANENVTFAPITKNVPGCKDDFCPLDVYSKIAANVKPLPSPQEFCNADPFSSKSVGAVSVLLAIFVAVFRF